ncbi:MAG TPA: hypothetical protein ENK18_17555 [Deltaproteobacteria bacterium]|nr:hypothetical protein [Deltaproteobacteria bacterium]
MHRNSTNEDISAYLDGELTDAEIADLEEQLSRDPGLRAALAELEGAVRWIRHAGPDQAPMGFHHRVMARIEEEHPERPPWWARLRRPLGIPLEGWLVAAAAAAVLFLALPGPDPGSPAPWAEGGGEEIEARPGAAALSGTRPPKAPAIGEGSGTLGEPGLLGSATPDPTQQPSDEALGIQQAPSGKERPSQEPQGEGPMDEGVLSEGALSEGVLSEGVLSEDVLSEGVLSKDVRGKGLERDLGTGAVVPVPSTLAPAAAPDPRPSSGALELRGGTAEGGPDAEGTSEPLATPGYTYTVRSSDPGMKRAVLSLAGRYGGARDLAGQEIPSSVMQQSTETLVVQVPQAELNAFGRALEALGFSVLRDKDDALLPGKMMPVRITLQLVGGSTSPSSTKANTTRDLDEMMEPLEAL